MANTIILKQSSVASKVPLSVDLVLGELAVNTTDGIIYMKKGDGSIVEFDQHPTATEFLDLIKTVDGTGSGLDADLLDGVDGSGYATAAQGTLADNAVASSIVGTANGVAPLDSGAKIPTIHLPATAISETFVAANETEMLALSATVGDTCIRTDENKTYILQNDPASVLGNWQEMLTPTDAVASVDGRQGTVILTDRYLELAATAANSTLLDSLDSTQFLRSDVSDAHSGTITPSNNNSINLGSVSLKYANVYATNFVGQATTAEYADLAENYEADADIDPGTVVCFGGDKEVTTCMHDADTAIAGIVSTDPAYTMNSDLDAEFVATVALRGRVPCKVSGTVTKGDMMVADGNGGARAETDPGVGMVLGRALADSEGDSVIEVVVA